MSAIDLFLLGFFVEPKRKLREEQKLPVKWSAYDLARFIGDNDLQELLKVSSQAIYKNLLRLAAKGHLKADILHGFVDKKTYSITEKGRAYFSDLMRKLVESTVKYHFDFNSYVVNLDKVPRREALEGLRKLNDSLEAKRAQLKAWEQKFSFIPTPGLAIIKQQIALNKTMLEWLKTFMDEYGGNE